MTIITVSVSILLKFVNKTQTKFSTLSDAEDDKGFSDISLESLRFRHTSGAIS